jgi:peptidylprolyl isomerase
MKIGESKTVTIEPKDAYGERDEKKLLPVKKTDIPDADQYQIGMQVMSQNGQVFKVYKVEKDELVFDANHELAGKTLVFDITIKNIQE